jgi:hypothetical protein
MRPHDRNRGGRPTKSEGPRVPYEEVDKILVFGEVVPVGDGDETTVYFPSYRELAERYGVSNSVISEYAKSRNVQRRRKEAQLRIQAKVEQKVVEMRAKAIAFSKEDELRIIDSYLAGFEKAIAEERVRFDNPADFNTMVRLKEFVMGNADSRQEIHASLSLEVLQTRHREMMRTVHVSPAERGEVGPAVLGTSRDVPLCVAGPPAAVVSESAREPHDRFPARFGETEHARTPIGSSEAADEDDEQCRGVPARDDHERAHENVRALSADGSGANGPNSSKNLDAQHETQRAPDGAAEHGAPRELEHEVDELGAETLRPAPASERER